MATSKPKISGYVPQELKDRLQKFCVENNSLSESQALTVILAEYFGCTQLLSKDADVSVGGVTLERFQVMEDSLRELTSKVKALEQMSNSVSETVVSESHCQVNTQPNLPRLLSGRKLAARLGINPSTLSVRAKNGADDFIRWSAQKDPDSIGWWRHQSGDGYEPVDHLNSTGGALPLDIKLTQ
jgi:hypothetical protein